MHRLTRGGCPTIYSTMLEALKLTDGDLNRLHKDRASGLGSFDVALIDAFLKADGNNRARLAYMFPWLMRGNCYNYGSERIVKRHFDGSFIEMDYMVRFSEAYAMSEWLTDMVEYSESVNEFIREIPIEIHILDIRVK